MEPKILRQKSPVPSLHHLVSLLQHRADEVLNRQIGIGLGQVRILAPLHTSVPHSQRAIAGKLQQTEANVSRQVRHMKNQGLVSIKRSTKDARQREVTLSVHGQRELQAALKILRVQEKKLLSLLKAEQTKHFKTASEDLARAIGFLDI